MSAPTPEAATGAGAHTDAVSQIVEDLGYAFESTFTGQEVRRAVEVAWSELAAVSRIPTYLPVLTARLARQRLTAAAQADGRMVKTVPELLFVCVHNAGRSQMAAALAAHLAPGRVHVRSAGSAPIGQINPVVVQVLAERGIDLREAFPKPLADDVVHAADVIVTMGCGDACPVLPGKRYEDWDVPDPAGRPVEVVRDIRDQLQARVTALLRELDL
ncbi:arsenate reductase ArsC [Ornithinimicrobium pekingense]|uniref:Low molecular weight phosphatase family protein n=1 Tax=Ornithinimicrobium pekingense TaxID=384677 RepID=A0ABQ2F5H9_9MICO|nr:arsenate reductase ArsC [Ornithinimicrobium pekingense]GGK63117.1 low molecular weight phosphatase family protein [Ornithinimicrobium pekingense]